MTPQCSSPSISLRSADELHPESDSDQSEISNTSFRTTLSFGALDAIQAEQISDPVQDFAKCDRQEADPIIADSEIEQQKEHRNEVEDHSLKDCIQPDSFAGLALPVLLINDELFAQDQSHHNKVSSNGSFYV